MPVDQVAMEVRHRQVDLFDGGFGVEHGRSHFEQRRLHRRAEPRREFANENRPDPFANRPPIVGSVVVDPLRRERCREDAIVRFGKRRVLILQKLREA